MRQAAWRSKDYSCTENGDWDIMGDGEFNSERVVLRSSLQRIKPLTHVALLKHPVHEEPERDRLHEHGSELQVCSMNLLVVLCSTKAPALHW